MHCLRLPIGAQQRIQRRLQRDACCRRDSPMVCSARGEKDLLTARPAKRTLSIIYWNCSSAKHDRVMSSHTCPVPCRIESRAR